MASFQNGPVEIAYLDEGAGEPIVLVHGFASTKEVNWVQPGWFETLKGAGRRVVAFDNRGHGASAKLYQPADYHSSLMAGDARALIEYLGLGRADVMGYSMGARIAAFLASEPCAVFPGFRAPQLGRSPKLLIIPAYPPGHLHRSTILSSPYDSGLAFSSALHD